MLYVEQIDTRGNPLGITTSRLMEGNVQGKAVELIFLDARTTKLWVGIGGVASGAVAFSEVEINFLAAVAGEAVPPLSAVGMVYHDVAEIAPMLREMIDQHEHYTRTAREFSRTWQQLHNADRLVAELGK